ncbi:MAG: hypothetical protein QG567_310 [Campylobacterota bacterium]|nr:hypothetical protein [Campylobacterota bacterium]MDQ1339159.1 hypothetical protein [Campylobacterota bacterium]
MKNIIIITFSLLLFVLTIALMSWFEEEELKVKAINAQNNKNIQKLQKIAQINSWLDSDIIPAISDDQNDSLITDKNMIYFFDDNRDKYNLLVDKYIYKDNFAKSIDLSYSIGKGDRDKFKDFIKIEYEEGFLQFRELKIDADGIVGKVQVVQPHNEENNLSQYNGEDDVPQ